MKRIATVVMLAALTFGVALLPAPDPAPQPLAGLIIDQPGIESPTDASIWYCAWAQANAERDSFIGVASINPATAEFTFPVAIPGEPADTATVDLLGPGGGGVQLSDIARRGDSPSFIEFSDGPSGAAATVIGDVVTTDTCVAQGPNEWFFAGGSTMTGDALKLRLFNPFPETAKVTVTGFSEIGVEALGDLRSFSVNPRSWRDVSFEELLRQRQTLILSVRVEEGLIVPAMSFTTGTDEAWWGGSDLSPSWEFPVVQTEGAAADLIIGNPGLSAVEVTIDLFGETTSIPGAFTVTVPAESPLRIPISEVGDGAFGLRIEASAPVTAGVVASGEAGTGATGGVPIGARSWLLPGVRTDGLDIASIWILNTSFDPVTVTISALTGAETVNLLQTVPPNSLVRIPVTEADAVGYLLTAGEPFSAGWTIAGPTGLGFATGIPVSE